MHEKQSGFTIVELLIVIVVIGILATVTIIAYSGIQNRAKAASVSSSLSQVSKKLAAQQVLDGGYPATLAIAGINNTDNVSYQYSVNNSSNPQTYCVTATNGNVSYFINSSTQTTPISGGCAGHGVGGIDPTINYALDPNAAGSGSGFGYAGTPVAATRTIASDRSYTGTTSLKTVITGASGQTGAQARVPTNGLRVNTGERLYWSFWVYSTKAGNLTPYMDGSKVSDATYTGGSSASVAVPANTWTKVSGTFTATLDLYVSQIGGYNLLVVTGDTVWFDTFMVEKSTSASNFADGDSPNWAWNGAANSSTSTGPPF